MKSNILFGLSTLLLFGACEHHPAEEKSLDMDSVNVDTAVELVEKNDTGAFVVLTDVAPEIMTEIRYAGYDNFIGRPVDGYLEDVAICTREAAAALKRVNDSLNPMGFCLKVFDAYRPVRAVKDFLRWRHDLADTLTRQKYYPNVSKGEMLALGYLSSKSNHCHGSTVDLTICNKSTGEELDMGTGFDFLDTRSHYLAEGVSKEQQSNRRLLRSIMIWGGFSPINNEWWHFCLKGEPYSESFDFPVHRDSIPSLK